MSDDIVSRLRNHGYIPLTDGPEWRYITLPVKWVEEAADEIVRLRGEVERLALERDYWARARNEWEKSARLLEEENKRLTRERDELQDALKLFKGAKLEWKAKTEAAEAKVVTLREALTPFAAEAEFCDEQTRVLGVPSLDDDDGIDVSVGDLRRARAVLQEIEE